MGNCKRGWFLNEKGYVRITSGKDRHKYAHRAVFERLLLSPLCASYVFPVPGVIPPGMVVHHNDHCRTHNCPENLMLMSTNLHNAVSRAHRSLCLLRQRAKWQEEQRLNEGAPEWVTERSAETSL